MIVKFLEDYKQATERELGEYQLNKEKAFDLGFEIFGI